MAKLKVCLFFILLFIVEIGQASHIGCGPSFSVCASESAGVQQQPRSRAYGISTAQWLGSHRQIPQPLITKIAHEAMIETRTFLETHPEQTFQTKSPIISTVRQYASLHPLQEKAKNFSEAAYVSNLMSLRLKKLGLQESDLTSGLDAKILMETELGDICPRESTEPCPASEYRSISGFCNNVKRPIWGAAFEPFIRLGGSAYSDGIMHPRESRQQKQLPNVRELSMRVFANPSVDHSVVNEMTAFWLYFVASDLARPVSAQISTSEGPLLLPCCENGFIHADCDPIFVAPTDVLYSKAGISCLPYTRSVPAPKKLCSLGPREQINVVTSFLDGSQIYGSTPEQQTRLRTKDGGRLLTSALSGATDLLPLDPDTKNYCQSSVFRKCFLSGTADVNLLPEISALHLLFVRQHNSIAKTLKDLNRHWNDDQIYQESRKIVIAQIQHITFNEFLPVLIGKDNIKNHHLELRDAGYSGDYDVDVDPSALNEFSTIAAAAAFSFLGSQRRKALSERFNNPDELYELDGMEKLFNHMVNDPAETPGLKFSSEFRGKFLRSKTSKIGFDFVAIALKQGRDHGIPGYAQIRRQCELPRIYTFNDLVSEFEDKDLALKLGEIYDSVDDIDLLIGVLAEKPKKGSFVGPTLACILGNAFFKVKTGDKYWYENFFAPSSFTDEQLVQIRRTTLARLICDLTKPEKMQLNAFMLPDSFSNNPIDCQTSIFPSLDLSAWKDLRTDLKLPITRETLQKVIKIAELNLKDQSRREISNIQKNQEVFKAGDPLFAYSNMMRAKPESKQVSHVSALLLESTRILLRGETLPDGETLPSLDIESIQKLLPQIDVSTFIANFTAFLSEDGRASKDECLPKMLPCDHTSKYRTFSGWCNNLKFPEYGNAFTPLRHLMPPVYDDGFDAPRSRAVSGRPLPSARAISNAIHVDKNVSHVKFTHMLMQFGQLIDHELTHSPINRGPNDEILNCTRCDSPQTISVHCAPLKIEPTDPYFPPFNPDGSPRCLPFARSLLGQLNLGYRNQLNQLTAFIDGSVIYGSTTCEANALRLFRRGLMNYTEIDGPTLPQGNQEKDCRSLPHNPCFVAGDERNSHQPGLTLMHTFFVREHNRIAEKLGSINPHWDDEKIFHETRRIQVAQLQHITFGEFLPKLIGWDLIHEYDLMTMKTGYYDGYDPTCDAAISHPFATAAYRFGHTLVRKFFPRLDFNYRSMNTSVDISQHFGHVGPIYDKKSGGMETMLMGLLGTPSMAFDRHITNALRNQLFERRGEAKSGMDLISLNILRARDHGVQSYNSFRPLCGFKKAVTFDDLLTEMDSEAISALRSVYEHVDDIDLFSGITSERPKKGALLGPTMSCILAEQFRRLKKCDRFYYENSNTAAKFSQAQLQEIRKTTLSKIFCQNSRYLKTIQPRVFDMPDDFTNAQVDCKDLPDVDLSLWKETAFCEMKGLKIAAGETKSVTPCVTCTCTADGIECHPTKVLSCEKLLHKFTLNEIRKDTACVIQCAELFGTEKDI